jgi:hypothetical protein
VSDDKYPRVRPLLADMFEAPQWVGGDGAYKAVPADAIVIERLDANVEPLAEWEEALLGGDAKSRAWNAVLRSVRAWLDTPEVNEAEVARIRRVLLGMGAGWERGDAELAENLWRAGLRVTEGATT